MKWVVLAIFLFPGHQSQKLWGTCESQACVRACVEHAQSDLNVTIYRVLQPNDLGIQDSEYPNFPPLIDGWKS